MVIPFLKAGNQWEQWLATLGIVGTAAFASLFAMAAWGGRRLFRRSKHVEIHFRCDRLEHEFDRKSVVTLFTFGIYAVYCRTCVVFWWLQLEGFSFPTWQWRWPSWVGTVFAVAVLTTAVAGIGWLGQTSVAAVALEHARILQNNNAPLTTVRETLEYGREIDPGNPLLTMALAQQHIAIVRDQVNGSSITSIEAADQIRAALVLADLSIGQDPKNPARYESVIDLYETLAQYVADADVGAATLYEKLITLESKNPRHEFGLGQTLLVKATRLAAEAETLTTDTDKAARRKDADAAVEEAKTNLQRVIELRQRYPDALLRMALAEELGGQAVAASNQLEVLVPLVPTSPDAW